MKTLTIFFESRIYQIRYKRELPDEFYVILPFWAGAIFQGDNFPVLKIKKEWVNPGGTVYKFSFADGRQIRHARWAKWKRLSGYQKLLQKKGWKVFLARKLKK